MKPIDKEEVQRKLEVLTQDPFDYARAFRTFYIRNPKAAQESMMRGFFTELKAYIKEVEQEAWQAGLQAGREQGYNNASIEEKDE